MSTELSAARFLEELADRVVAQIDAGSTGGFERIFEEMIDYHRFLLDAYATADPSGGSNSYARLEMRWRPLHSEWIDSYRKIIDRAVSKIGSDTSFAESICHLPHRLFPDRPESTHSDVLLGILDIGSLVVHRLELWLSRQNLLPERSAAVSVPVVLGPNDAVAYEDVLKTLVGAWESLPGRAPGLSSEAEAPSDHDLWEGYRRSWPILRCHLRNAAEFLVRAVWNRDAVGSAWFRDLLLRWRGSFLVHGKFPQPERSFEWPELVTADWLQLDWPAASAQAAIHRSKGWGDISASDLFSAILDNAHSDVLLICAGIMSNWTVSAKTGSFALGQVSLLLRSKTFEHQGEDFDEERQPLRFTRVYRHWVAMELTGTPTARYGAELDQIVQALDQYSEQNQVSGRVFESTTAHHRTDLERAWTLILLAGASERGAHTLIQDFSRLVEGSGPFASSDDALRGLLDILRRQDAALESLDEQTRALALNLNPTADVEDAALQLGAIHAAVNAAIRRVRDARISTAKINSQRVDEITAIVDATLHEIPGEIDFFSDFIVESDPDALDKTSRFGGVDKARFVDPPMDQPFPQYNIAVAQRMTRQIAGRIWLDFLHRERQTTSVLVGPDQLEFWHQIKALAQVAGPNAHLILPVRAYQAFADRLLRGSQLIAFNVVRKELPAGPTRYVMTLDGIDIHALDWTAGEAWLFSGTALGRVGYKPRTNGRWAEVSFEEDSESPWKGTLVSQVGQSLHWRDRPAFTINFPTTEVQGGELSDRSG